MISISRKLEQESFKSKMILQVHDELLFECPNKEKKRLEKMIKETMEGALKLKVPLIVHIGSGINWNDAH